MTWKRLFAISAGLILFATPVNAGFRSAQLSVNGLSCPFCAFGIEKKLLDVPGVLDVEVFLDEGRVALTFQGDSEATVSDLEQAVRKAGFELSGLSLETDGEVQHPGQRDVRLVVHPGMTFRLGEETDGRDHAVSEAALQRMRQKTASDGQTWIVEGTVAERDAQEPRLLVHKIDPVSDAP